MKLSLKDVQENFQTYRGKRKMSRFPIKLWEQAISLQKTYSRIEICKALRGSTSTLRKYGNIVNGKNSIANPVELQNNNFIPLGSFEDIVQENIQTNNKELKIKISGSPKDIADLLFRLGRGKVS